MTKQTVWVGLAVALCALGCKKVEPSKHHKAADIPLRAPAKVLKSALAHVPAGVDVVVVLDLQPVMGILGQGNTFGMLPGVADPKAFQADMARVYQRFLGFDLAGVQGAVGFAKFDGELIGAVVLGKLGSIALDGDEVAFGRLKTRRLDRETYAAPIKGGIILGNDQTMIALGQSKKRLSGKLLALHRQAMDRLGPSLVAASGQINDTIRQALASNTPMTDANFTHASVGLGYGMTIQVTGDDASRKLLTSTISQGMQMARGMLDKLAKQIDTADTLEKASAAVLAKHMGPVLLDLPEVTDANGRVTISVAIPTTADAALLSVALASTTAVVAVPAFIKYRRRAMTSEAIDQLDKIYKGAANYYTAPPSLDQHGKALPCQFPAAQSMTPNTGNLNCCSGKHDVDGDEKCDVDTTQWATPTWTALNFQMTDQHYFGYEFSSSGTGARARFTASAYADLDCDGILSTFERYGYGDESGTAAMCSMKGSSAFYKNKETE
jgi:hypothetical protein